MIRLVGILDLLGLIAWVVVMRGVHAAGGGRPWDPVVLFLFCGPLAYFLLSFVSTAPFFKPRGMLILGVLANLATLPFFISVLTEDVSLYLSAPLLILTVLWFVAYRKKRSTHRTNAAA